MIGQIDKSRFRIPMSGHPELHRELKWYATGDDAVLGVVFLNLVDKDYSWAVLTEKVKGQGFAAIATGTELATEEDAAAALHAAMRFTQWVMRGTK
jgi:hypothetical protein